MDNQSFELLMSKLQGLEDGQARIENSLGKRLDEHYVIVAKHIEDDKETAKAIANLDKEITFAKGVTYTINGVAAAVYAFFGWGK